MKTSDIYGYYDTDWANYLSDRRSLTGYIFLKNGSLISLNSKKNLNCSVVYYRGSIYGNVNGSKGIINLVVHR